jgi:hypothetical protein
MTICNPSGGAYIHNWEQRNYASIFPLQFVILRGQRYVCVCQWSEDDMLQKIGLASQIIAPSHPHK